MTTAFFTEAALDGHTWHGHVEHAGRLQAVRQLYEESGVLADLQAVTATPATPEQLARVHHQPYLDVLEKTSHLKHPAQLDADTYILPASFALAKLAAGGVIRVVEAVLTGQAQNGIAAVRPPGHHATPERGMGFCLLNNIAIAARHAYTTYDLQRVAIVDFDVHHGNGTQDAFYVDPKVLFISSHQSPLYPGTGMLEEAGAGTIINAPLPAGTGDQGFRTLYEEALFPALKRYQPQLILVSAGFDAHWDDPLASLQLSLSGFNFLTRRLIETAGELCNGRIVFVMEGGYNLTVLSHGWLNIAYALLGRDEMRDPLGMSKVDRPLSTPLLQRIRELHGL